MAYNKFFEPIVDSPPPVTSAAEPELVDLAQDNDPMLVDLTQDSEEVDDDDKNTKVTTKLYSEDRRKSQETEELSAGLCNLRTSSISPTNDHRSSFDAAIKTQDFDEPFHIIATSDCQDGLLCKALLSGNLEAAVKLCIQEQRWADAILLAQASGPDLLSETKKLYCKSVSTNSSKLICAIGTSGWMSVIRCCAIDCWKEIFAAILTYAKPEEFVQLCELLGSRLETEKEGTFISNAALCYISSGNLQNLAQCWAKCNGKKICASALQDLVEKIMILRSAVEYLSGNVPTIQNGELAFYVGLYASILASQGNLASAAMYLADSKEQSLAILKDRVYQALGHRSPYFPFNAVDVQREKTSNFDAPYQHQQRVHPEQTPFQTQVQQHPTPYQQQPQQQQIFPERKFSFQPQYNYGDMSNPSMPRMFPPSGVPNSSIPSSVPPLPASSLPVHTSVPPPSVDAVNNSPGKNITCGHHMSQKYPKHVYDSSVYSDNAFNQQYYPVSQAQPNSFILQNTSQQSTMSYYSTETNTSAPCSSGSGSFAHNPSTAYTFSPTNYGTQVPMSSFPETGPSPVAMPGLPSMYGEMKTGWNDPPLLRRNSGTLSASAYDTAPITVPLMGDSVVDVAQVTPLPGDSYNPAYNVPSQIQPVNMMKEPITTAPLPTPTPQAKAVEPPKEKGPIPPEHQQLYDVFEDLRHKCVQVTRNPQVKRKLEDVAKKLENLYDQLRENTLSEPVLFGLHQIIQAVMKNDYQATLGIHGHIVSTTNFSEISGFMPSIKVLLQTASQLGVYLQ